MYYLDLKFIICKYTACRPNCNEIKYDVKRTRSPLEKSEETRYHSQILQFFRPKLFPPISYRENIFIKVVLSSLSVTTFKIAPKDYEAYLCKYIVLSTQNATSISWMYVRNYRPFLRIYSWPRRLHGYDNGRKLDQHYRTCYLLHLVDLHYFHFLL